MAAAATPLQLFKSRVQVGVGMELITYEINGQARTHRFMNVRRVVAMTNTRQFALQADGGPWSYCDWPKATELTWLDANTARIDDGGCRLEYRIG